MKLSRKTFVYSIIMSVVIVGMVVLYFVTMLPALYVDHMQRQNLQSVIDVEKGYMEKRSYKGLLIQNPTSTATLEIPFDGETVYLAGQGFRMDITVREGAVRQLLEQIRTCIREEKELGRDSFEEIDWSLLRSVFPEEELEKEMPFEITMNIEEGIEDNYSNGESRVHFVDEDVLVLESGIVNGGNQYTSYLAVGKSKEALIITALYVMTPQMKEMKTIVLGSVPMIAAVLFLLVLLCSRFFSGRIVQPVVRLTNYAQTVKYAQNRNLAPLEVTGKDEIGELGRILNELYEKLRENYRELEEKNAYLERENKRQEVFLRASSHQLKTPVTAALLLVDGMMQEVGKYKDTKKYLPQVKEQLLSMRRIVEDILYLNHCTDHLEKETVDAVPLMEELLGAYRIQTEEKGLRCRTEGDCRIYSDRELLKKMLDNLIANAVAYTQSGGSIEIHMREGLISIRNEKAHIEEELLAHVYEPFVSGTQGQKGKGLGLYIARYYCEVLGIWLTLENVGEGVLAKLIFPQKSTASSSDLHIESLE